MKKKGALIERIKQEPELALVLGLAALFMCADIANGGRGKYGRPERVRYAMDEAKELIAVVKELP